MNHIHKIEKIVLITVFLLLCFFPLFLHLDSLTLRMWDESRPAVNAIEMTQNGNLLVTHYEGKPDMWYSKPPLLVWLQASFMNLLGYNEWAVRLPVAIACYLTAIFLFSFGWLFLKSPKIGFLTGLILVCTNGYIDIHVTRTGDVDGLMILWMTIYMLSYFKYLHSEENKNYYLAITIVCLTLAILTKSVAGILPLPALFIYTIWQGKLKEILTNRSLYLLILIPLVFVGGYYLLREHYNPGYLEAVNNNELGTRYLSAIEGQAGDNWMYFNQLTSETIYWDQNLILRERLNSIWLLLFPVCLIIGFTHKNKIYQKLILYCTIFIVTYLLIITFAQTKLYWYDAPIFPFTALIIAIGCSQIHYALIEYFQVKSTAKKYLVFVLLTLCIVFVPYRQAINKVISPKENWWGWGKLLYGDYMKKMDKSDLKLKEYSVIHSDYNAHLVFYVKAFNLNGSKITVDSINKTFSKGDIIITCEPEIKQTLEQRYNLIVLDAETFCFTMKIESQRIIDSTSLK